MAWNSLSLTLLSAGVVCGALCAPAWAQRTGLGAGAAAPAGTATAEPRDAKQGPQDGVRKPFAVPMQYGPTKTPLRPVVWVSLNGSEPMPFLLDTGAATTVMVEPWAAQKARLKKSKKRVALLPGNLTAAEVPGVRVAFAGGGASPSAVDGPKSTAPILTGETDEHPAGTFDIYAFDSDSGSAQSPENSRLAGIVGSGLLSRFNVRLDFPRGRMVLAPHGGELAVSDPAGTAARGVLPLRMQGVPGAPEALLPSVEVGVLARGKAVPPLRLVVDTGAAWTFLSSEDFDRLTASGGVPTQVAQGADLAGPFSTCMARVDEMRLGELQIKGPVLRRFRRGWGVLGMDVLRHHAVTLDFEHGLAVLEPAPGAAGYRPGGVTGVHDILIPAEEGSTPLLYVMLVSPGSPAADAGIEAGEVITEVDGRAPGDPLAVLSGPAGERVTLRVRKGVEQAEPTRTVTLVRADEMQFGEFLLPNLGLALVRSAGGRVHVLISIDPSSGFRGAVKMSTDSPAYAAGVRSRQEIVSINGKPATEWSPMRLIALADLPDGAEVTLGLRRPGDGQNDPPTVVKVKTRRNK